MNKPLIALSFATVLTLASCGPSEEKKAEAPPPASAPAAAPVDEASAATVTGKVTFTGTKPAAKNLDMSATPFCAKAHTTPAKTEDAVVDAAGGVKYAFVYVKSGLPERTWPTPAQAVTLDQKGCMYTPRVIGVMMGQNIEVTNSDQTNHNIHPQPNVNNEWNESQGPGTPPKIKTFAREEVAIQVKCNIHPWMRSYIAVLPHPFHAVTADDGTFTIKGLPPGSYTVTVWHERFGSVDQPVTVGAKESKTVDFALKG